MAALSKSQKINTDNWPTVVRVRLGAGKPELDDVALWIAQTDYRLNTTTSDLRKRALYVARYILNTPKIADNRDLVEGCQNWLRIKVSMLEQVDTKAFAKFCEAHNFCAKALDEPTMELEGYIKSFGFTKEEEKESPAEL